MKPIKVLKIQGGYSNLTNIPEMAMGIQYFEGSIDFFSKESMNIRGLILSTYYVLPIIDDAFIRQYKYQFMRDFLSSSGDPELCCIREDSQCGWTVAWDDSLPTEGVELGISPSSPKKRQDQLSAFFTALTQAFPQQQALIPPPGTPRTLTTQTTGDDGFLRFTFQVPDRRVDSVNGSVAPGTFCSPFRDGEKISCGFEAVGRFALPVPLPYKHVVLLVPPAGTDVEIGTVVPNFGQAGGGVEAFFPNGFTNPNLHYHLLPSY